MRPINRGSRVRSKPSRGAPGNPINRVYDSTGPEGKVRGTPQQIIDKYHQLSRDASTSGDHVVAESFLQHAEHYARILTSARRAAQQRREERYGDMAPNEALPPHDRGGLAPPDGEEPPRRAGRVRLAERAAASPVPSDEPPPIDFD